MSEYGNFIKAQIDQSGKPGYEFAARMGLDPTQLSAFINGRRTGVNVETLAKMVLGISEEPAVRAGLLEAYFRDQALPEMKQWVRVIPPAKKGARTQEEAEGVYGNKALALELEETIRRLATPTDTVKAIREILESMPGHKALEDLIQELAAFARDALKAG